MKLFFSFFLLSMSIQGNLLAQTSGKESSDFSYFLGDLSYVSDAVFMGRRDSIKAPYLYSSLGYYDKSGFFGNASASYLVASEENKFDLFLLSAGYLYTGKQFSAGLSGTKYFFDEESYNVQSEIEGNITAMLAYDFNIAEISLSAAGYFGSGSSADVVAGLKLDRAFYALDRNLLINPGIILQAGTQYFYEEYYNTSRLGNRKGGKGQQGPGTGPGGGNGNMGIMQTEASNVSISEASE